ncbi:hypothetical protein Salbus254_3730 [Streptomyces albidoflavus]|nr:hypothetical protein Salbus254_3730 [Streptomyces albidoflavus]
MSTHHVRITHHAERDLRQAARWATRPQSLLAELHLLASFPNAGDRLPGDLAAYRSRHILDDQGLVVWRVLPGPDAYGKGKTVEVRAIIPKHSWSDGALSKEVRRRLQTPGTLRSRPLPDTLAP